MSRIARAAAVAVLFAAGFLASCSSAPHGPTTLTIATVNNGDMVRLQALTPEFTRLHPEIKVRWVTLEEQLLRQRVTTDIAMRGGQFDIVTIGTYEVPMWGRQKWLVPLDDLPASYRKDDLLPNVRAALSVDGTLYASPFYAESSFTMYRRDLFARAGLAMPGHPSWAFIADAARKLTDPKAGTYGICLRGKAGWGENMAIIQAMGNSFGARMFDEHWRPQFDRPQWRRTIETYVSLLRQSGPPGATANGFNENLALFNAGKCAIWIDASVAGAFTLDRRKSSVSDSVAFTFAPDAKLGKSANWLWAWALAIPTSSRKATAAKQFIAWATDPQYTELVAAREGWANVPPGTRASLYANPQYRTAAPFAAITLASIEGADPVHPALDKVPYVGVQYVAIPEYQGIGTITGQIFSAALSGAITPTEALAQAQSATRREMIDGGYLKN